MRSIDRSQTDLANSINVTQETIEATEEDENMSQGIILKFIYVNLLANDTSPADKETKTKVVNSKKAVKAKKKIKKVLNSIIFSYQNLYKFSNFRLHLTTVISYKTKLRFCIMQIIFRLMIPCVGFSINYSKIDDIIEIADGNPRPDVSLYNIG